MCIAHARTEPGEHERRPAGRPRGGDPDLLDQRAALALGDLLDGRPKRADPTAGERFGMALEHARLALRLQGDTRKTAIEFRKHLGWYTKGLPGGADLRQRLFAIESMSEAEAIFSGYLTETAALAAA